MAKRLTRILLDDVERRCGIHSWLLIGEQTVTRGQEEEQGDDPRSFSRKELAGNYTYGAKLHRPSTIEQVQEIIANAPRVRVLGSRHSFNDIADSSELISLEAMPMDVVVDHATDTVSFNAALSTASWYTR